jgi:hypothetical protein
MVKIKKALLRYIYSIYIFILGIKFHNQNVVIAYGPAMGDLLFSLAYFNSITSESLETVLICSERSKWICELFMLTNTKILAKSSKVLEHLAIAVEPSIHHRIYSMFCKRNLYIVNANAYLKEMHENNYLLVDLLKNEVFKCDAQIQRPIVPSVKVNVDIPQNSVLLSFSYSAKAEDINEWETLAMTLNKLGYTVFCNCETNEDAPIKGTESLVLTMIEVYNIAPKFTCFIGMRSGFFDFIIDNAKKIICVNTEIIQSWWNLKQWDSNCDVRNISFNKETFVSDVVENL